MDLVTVILFCICSTLCFHFILALIRFINKVWWTPIRLQTMMKSQGIRGPPYRFPHGSTKEISKMRSQSMEKPMEMSHNIFPRIQPHIYSWTKTYGKFSFLFEFLVFLFDFRNEVSIVAEKLCVNLISYLIVLLYFLVDRDEFS